jgi:hypothetical protein
MKKYIVGISKNLRHEAMFWYKKLFEKKQCPCQKQEDYLMSKYGWRS